MAPTAQLHGDPLQLYRARYLVRPGRPIVEDGAIVVRQARIVAAGQAARLQSEHPDARVTDCGDALLLPPLVNAHTHLELSDFPQWAHQAGERETPRNFVDWLLRMIRVKRRVAREAFLPSLQQGVRQSLRAGVGAVGDILSIYNAREAYADAPLLGRVFYEILGRDEQQGQQLQASVLPLLNKPAGRLGPALSPHAPYTVADELMSAALRAATEHEVPLAVHLAESSGEVELLQSNSGPFVEQLFPYVGWQAAALPAPATSPLAWLAARGPIGRMTLVIHGVHLTDSDIDTLGGAGATVVLCPRSNSLLQVGRANAGRMLHAGVNLALGTDSLASNDSLSVWDEMAFAYDWFDGALAPPDLLHMATLGGARALGLDGELGQLEAGWGAHFQVLRPVNLLQAGELEEFLVSPGRSAEVESLYLHGRNVLTDSVS